MEYGNKIGKIACHQTTEILEYKPKQSIGFYTLRNGGQQDKFEEGGRKRGGLLHRCLEQTPASRTAIAYFTFEEL